MKYFLVKYLKISITNFLLFATHSAAQLSFKKIENFIKSSPIYLYLLSNHHRNRWDFSFESMWRSIRHRQLESQYSHCRTNVLLTTVSKTIDVKQKKKLKSKRKFIKTCLWQKHIKCYCNHVLKSLVAMEIEDVQGMLDLSFDLKFMTNVVSIWLKKFKFSIFRVIRDLWEEHHSAYNKFRKKWLSKQLHVRMRHFHVKNDKHLFLEIKTIPLFPKETTLKCIHTGKVWKNGTETISDIYFTVLPT